MSDGDAHDRQREVIGRPLTPRALAELRPEVQALADDLVDRLVARGSFDAVADLAEVIPTTWVPDLLGWPAEGRADLLRWASDNFDALGPDNARCAAAGPAWWRWRPAGRGRARRPPARVHGGRRARRRGTGRHRAGPVPDAPRRLPGAVARHHRQRARQRHLAVRPAPGPVGPAPPRTRAGEGGLQRSAPARVPISCFTPRRHRAGLGGAVRARGARVPVLFASANRDERRWDRPDEFDITANRPATSASGTASTRAPAWASPASKATPSSPALAARVARFELGLPSGSSTTSSGPSARCR